MDWIDHSIWWQVYPIGFAGAERSRPNGPVEHRLPQLVGWLDYLIALGANGLILNPIFDSISHGYDTLNHYTIDPRLGDDADFDYLLAEAKKRGIRVVLDGVFNHVSRYHGIVLEALQDGPDSEAGRWLKWSDGHPMVFEGHSDLVELNLAEPMVADYITDIMLTWLERGIDGWRLDAAYAPGPDAWKPICDAVHAAYPESWILAEVIHGDYSEFAERSGVDSVTQYEFWAATWRSLRDHNFYELEHTLGRYPMFLRAQRPFTFVGNHDVTRIATQVQDQRHFGHAVALLMVAPGIPCVYAGDEQGFQAVKEERFGGDDAIRPRFPETPHGLLADGIPRFELHQELIAFRRRNPWIIDATIGTRDVSDETVVVVVSGAETIELALNVSDEPMPAPAGEVLIVSDHVSADVPAHGWMITRPTSTQGDTAT